MPDLEFPEFSNYPPPPPGLTFEQHQWWICGEIATLLAHEGKFSLKKLIEDFKNTGRRQIEEGLDSGHRRFTGFSSDLIKKWRVETEVLEYSFPSNPVPSAAEGLGEGSE